MYTLHVFIHSCFCGMIFNDLKILDFFLVISYKFLISHLKMFKIHVCSKTIIPLFYSVIDIMHISRILNQQSTLHHSINY
jgi:hypothetical protein